MRACVAVPISLLVVVGLVGGGLPAAASDRSPAADTSPTPLRILAYNIHHGAGNDEKLDLERIASLIRSLDPHLVALQEVDNRTERTGSVDQAAELGRLTGLDWAFGPFMDYQGGEYGMAVLSALPIERSTNHRLPEGPEPRSSLAVRVSLPGDAGEMVFASIHFYRTAEERMAQARRLLEILEPEEQPVILAGDFNSRPGSEVMEQIGETFAIPDKGDDRFTFPSDRPDREIDFIVYRPADRMTVLESRVIDEPVMSDHRPVFLVVEIQ
jgi:endonuclease/exonuclease/phosphatase family metal-dependent hydrolase